ncbi:MAG: prophage tail fiber N-terminal domain-containing protein [Plesiomonas sp.]
MVKISGRLVEPADDKPRSGVTLTLYSVKNSSVVLKHATYQCVTGGNGEYSFNAAPGIYDIAVSIYGAEPERVGQIRVYFDSLPGDLNTFLMAPGEDDLTPEIIRLVDSMRGEAVKAAESAKNSEQKITQLASDVATHAEQVASDRAVVEQKTTLATNAAKTAVAAKDQTAKDATATGQNRQVTENKAQEATTSANAANAARDSIVGDASDVRAKATQVSENAVSVANNAAAVQRNTEQVAQNTQTVSSKAQQVAENTHAVAANTQSVTQMRDEVAAKTIMAQSAADTATQKAASAAEHDAAAAEYARQAQEAAAATAGALIDGGSADLSSGVYPPPVQVGRTARSTFWKVTKGGTVGGVDYGVGDTLIYTTSGGGSYYKIDNTESVTSVQGEKGAVTLTPEKIGAEPAGSVAAAINQHSGKAGAHTISGVLGLSDALDAKLDSSAQLVPDGQDLIAFLRNTKTKLIRTGAGVVNAPKGWIGGDMLVIDHGANYRCVFAIGLDGICHSLAIYPDKVVGWVQQYGSNSIVGDVSQIGGVPTGAIIQTGTNVNGRYIKYADGTLINFCRLTVPSTVVNHNFSATTAWPHSFIERPDHVSFTMLGTDSGNVYAMGQLNKNGYKDNSSAIYAIVDGYTYTDPLSTVVIMSAAGYGRWY